MDEKRRLRAEIAALQSRLADLEAREACTAGNGGQPAAAAAGGSSGDDGNGDAAVRAAAAAAPTTAAAAAASAAPPIIAYVSPHGLTKQQAERYSRQVVLPSFGAAAQARLCRASALIVGCGGLGAPAALYLAAAGVGRLGLVDHDTVDVSNLHRQVIHTEARAGAPKAASAAAAVAALNSSVAVEAVEAPAAPATAAALVARYDVVLDCSDNAPTRYLLSDACAAADRPLVSAAAVGTEGQLTVYCHGEDGPCYRCLFPEPPAPGNCQRCADAGVLGPVPGVMGVLQALEAVKLLSGAGAPLSRTLLLFDALAGRFTSVRLRARSPDCAACGGGGKDGADEQQQAGRAASDGSKQPQEQQQQGEKASQPRGRMTPADVAAFDYEAFTGQRPHDGAPPPLRALAPDERLAPAEFAARLLAGGGVGSSGSGSDAGGGGSVEAPLLVDVRPAAQFEALRLPGAVSAPLDDAARFRQQHVPRLVALARGGGDGSGGDADGSGGGGGGAHGSNARERPVLVLCRRGNASQLAVKELRAAGLARVLDLAGGLEAWAREVDPSMPVL